MARRSRQRSSSRVLGWNRHVRISIRSSSIASVCGISKRTLYEQFTDREHLVRQTIETYVKQQEAMLSFRQTLIDAGTEVNNALVAWQTARDRLNVDQRLIMNLQAAVWNTNLLMKHGLTNYLEVLTAQQTLLQAELAQSSDKYAEIQSVIYLYHALGGGAEPADQEN